MQGRGSIGCLVIALALFGHPAGLATPITFSTTTSHIQIPYA